MTAIKGMELVSTANLADGCMSAGVPFAVAETIQPLREGDRVQGKALPVTHFGSVDIFLEAIEAADPGDVLVIDNQGRDDEGCIGDLTVMEAAAAGIAGFVVWGRHRDTAELRAAGMPIFSRGCFPVGPRRLDSRPPDALGTAVCAGNLITKDHMVVADDDGVVFIPEGQFARAWDAALAIRRSETTQLGLLRTGKTLREQLDWKGYVRARAGGAALTFREHLRRHGGAIEV